MTDEQPLRRLVSIPDAQKMLGDLGRTTVYNLIDQGELQRVNIGRRAFICVDSIDAYVDRLVQTAKLEAGTSLAQGLREFAAGQRDSTDWLFEKDSQ